MMAARVFEGSKPAPALHNHRFKQNQMYNLHGFRKSWGKGWKEDKNNQNSNDVEKTNKKFNFFKVRWSLTAELCTWDW